jgi:hypothetical protein
VILVASTALVIADDLALREYVSAAPLEELDRALVVSGGGARFERSKVAALAGFGIFLARIQPEFSGTECSYHLKLPSFVV